MSDRPIDIKVGEGQKSTAVTLSQATEELEPTCTAEEWNNWSPEQKEAFSAKVAAWGEKMKADYKKHRLARVLDRGFTIDRLTVDLPPHLWGEWIPNTPHDRARASLLGFTEDKDFAINRSLHDGGDGSATVGDVTFMVQPMWKHEALLEEKARIYYETHLKPRQKEERDAQKMIEEQLGMPTTIGSVSEQVKGTQLTETMLKTPQKQTSG